MNRFALAWIAPVTLSLGCFASTEGESPDPDLTKEEAAARDGKSDAGADLCDLLGWYDDGVCDTFCPSPDPDCDATCLAFPSCDPGETEHATESDCPADTSCRPVTLCGATIWCSAGGECAGPNPAGCVSTGCAEGFVCDTTMGTAPSACACDPESGTWVCTADVSGGTCVPEAVCAGYPSCEPGETEHATESECPADASCRAVTLCGATIWCSGGGATCAGDNPQGCAESGCATGYVCDTTMGTAPSACVCEAKTGSWLCTPDLNGGVCVPE